MTQKTIGIIIFDGVLTSEVIGPAEVFGIAQQEAWFAGWQVKMIGVANKEWFTTAEGITVRADCTIYDPVVLDVLLVAGGSGMDALINNADLNAFIRRHENQAEWIGSNCSGAFLLASTGVLDGVNATTWFGGEAKLQAQYPQVNVVMDAPVVVDNRRVTSNGGLVSYQAAIVLLGKLTSPQNAREVYDALTMGRLDQWDVIEQSMLN
ncbi:MAG: DJ-1/PfpI family protein [Chloroflexi bacterium]|nr:DJ-1/PfpI family protein [Chloroflexota bacterium]